ncbi:hypothetical protein [Nocardioides sp. NPDC047086]|uniref:hypothetical protein n=1 Tax=Nocardioides sp. NPDC047086 TaxID=3154810 RepID=UPI0033E489D9
MALLVAIPVVALALPAEATASEPSPAISASEDASANPPLPSAYVAGKPKVLKPSGSYTGWQTFRSKGPGLSIKVPRTWKEDEQLATIDGDNESGITGADQRFITLPPWGEGVADWTGLVELFAKKDEPLFGGPTEDVSDMPAWLDGQVASRLHDPTMAFRLPNLKVGGLELYHYVDYSSGDGGARWHKFGGYHKKHFINFSWSFHYMISAEEVEKYINQIMATIKVS